ncbi:MAG TPA: hypothetical protein VFR51_06005 [Pyrinomonadaceae bacterium]|nr:hypothetical protein [Pyrinomonadaceae bacterium]
MKSVKCPRCGLVAFASALTCKRCGQSFETATKPEPEGGQVDTALQKEIQPRQTLIYIVGFGGTTVLTLTAAFLVESIRTMIVLFIGILNVGWIWTWALGNRAESQLLAGRKRLYTITPAQRAFVTTSSVALAGIILSSDYGYILSPLVIVIINGGMYLYEREMRVRRAESGD